MSQNPFGFDRFDRFRRISPRDQSGFRNRLRIFGFDSPPEVDDEQLDELFRDRVAGDLIVCDTCKNEFVLEADAADRPDDPLMAVAHDAVPACPHCREVMCDMLGIPEAA